MFRILRSLFRSSSPVRKSAHSRFAQLGLQALEERALMATALGGIVPVWPSSPVGSDGLSGEHTIARADNGNYAIVLDHDDSMASNKGIYLALFKSDGTASSPVVRIPGSTSLDHKATIAMNSRGQFVVAWEHDYNGNGSDMDIYAQRFAADGTTLGNTLHVATTGLQERLPTVGIDRNGNVTIAYERLVSAGNYDVLAEQYDTSGHFVRHINIATDTRSEFTPSLAENADGRFVVAYSSSYSAQDTDLAARAFSPAGTLLNTTAIATSTANEIDPSVGIDAGGNYVVSYTLQRTSTHMGPFGPITDVISSEVMAQRVNSLGVTLGSPISVGVTSNSFETDSSVAVAANGRFVITMTRDCNNTGDFDVVAQQFDVSGHGVGTFYVANSSNYREQNSSVAIDAAGDFVVNFATYGKRPEYIPAGDMFLHAAGEVDMRRYSF